MIDLQKQRLYFILENNAFSSAAVEELSRHPEWSISVLDGGDLVKSTDLLQNLESPDLIILALNFDSSHLLKITNELSNNHPGIPLLLISEAKDFHLAVEALKNGVDDYLIREELTPTSLAHTIKKLFERAKTQRTIQQAIRDKIIAQRRAEAIKELVVTICHEFNNPLAAIKISADIISRQIKGNREQEAIDHLEKNIRQLEDEINRLREISKPMENTSLDEFFP